MNTIEDKSDYKLTVGIEVHAELTTKSKMFCGCKNAPHDSVPNQNTCPVCLAHPGTLPTVNKEAVKKVLQVGEAVGGELANYSEFDRKNYFYPDIPKAYQLSQYAFPFVKGGELAGVTLTRIHLEEDTARSQHEQGVGSSVDFNRAGVPLMELVTEPVIHDAETAGKFAKELQLLLRMLGVSEANMEKGEMRVEANISISKSDKLGTKVEVKNLNSFKSVVSAIEYEVRRQSELLDKGESLVQETRGWDETKEKTFSQRSKETAEDYRYFPDPDIPKYELSDVGEFNVSRLSEIRPKLALELRSEYRDLGIKDDQIEQLLYSESLRTYMSEFVTAAESGLIVRGVNYLTSDVVGLLQDNDALVLAADTAAQFAELMRMLERNEINSRGAKDMLCEVVFEGRNPQKIASEKGLLQMNSEAELTKIVDEIITENQEVVAEYKAGKEASLKFLVGQGMKLTKGSANPQLLEKVLQSKLS